MKLSPKAQTIIEKSIYASVATVDQNGNPWNAPVFVAYDENYTFYWGSDSESQHSKNVRANTKAFLVIYDSNAKPSEGEGVYIQASVIEVTDFEEIKRAHQLLWNRHLVPYWKLEQVQAPAPVRLYKAISQQIWMNGEGSRDGQYIDIRVEATN